jgi:hypothetical protein
MCVTLLILIMLGANLVVHDMLSKTLNFMKGTHIDIQYHFFQE